MPAMRAVVTGFLGDAWSEIAKITHPRMQSFAERHGCNFICDAEGWGGVRPLSWSKLLSISRALSDYEEIVWIDTDVIVLREGESIFECVPGDCVQAAVPLHCPTRGEHFNLGVWILKRKASPLLVEAAMMDHMIHDPWWEQAAVNEITRSGRFPTFRLDAKWNAWADAGSGEPCFYHACKSQAVVEKLKDLNKWL